MRESDNKRRERRKRMKARVVVTNPLKNLIAGLQIEPMRGYIFYPPKTGNQRQKRKSWRQNPHTRPKK